MVDDKEHNLIDKVIRFKKLKQYNFCIRLLEKLYNLTNDIFYIKAIAYMFYLNKENRKAIETMIFYFELVDKELENF